MSKQIWRQLALGMWWSIACLAISLDFRDLKAADDMAEQRKLLTFVKESYRANVDAFSFCTCEFVHIQGHVDSIESALKGQVNQPVIQDGIWTYNGPKIKHQLKCRNPFDPKVTPPAKEGKMALECPGLGSLTDGSVFLDYSPDASIANIFSPERSAKAMSYYWTPFRVGLMGGDGSSSPPNLIEEALRGEKNWKVIQPADVSRPSPYVSIAISALDKPTTFLYKFNIEKGCLPESLSAYLEGMTNRVYELRTVDIFACSKNRWFPKRTVTIWWPDAKNASYKVDIMEVTKLNVDTPPSDEELTLTIPAGVQVSEPGMTDSLYRSNAAENISINHLKDVLQKCRAHKEWVAEQSARRPTSKRTWFILINIIVLGAACLLIWYRTRKRVST